MPAVGAGGFEILVAQVDVFALPDLEGLDDLLVGHRLVLGLADLLVADRALVGLVDQLELQLVLGDRRIEPYGHRDEAERQRPVPERSRRHDLGVSGVASAETWNVCHMPVRSVYPTAVPFLPERRTLPSLERAVQGCRGCPLYARATQAVFGQGPVPAG